MTNENIIKECLSRYIQVILQFENTLKKVYNLPDNPYRCKNSFPKVGKVGDENDIFDYRFHGSGCSFDYRNLEVHYDYHIVSENYITTSPWKFWRFVETYSKLKGWNTLTRDQVADGLEQLSKSNLIHNLYPGHPIYRVYQILFSVE